MGVLRGCQREPSVLQGVLRGLATPSWIVSSGDIDSEDYQYHESASRIGYPDFSDSLD